MNKAILEKIRESVDPEGSLPNDFHLTEETATEGAKFVPGAMDGIIFYHMGINGSNDEETLSLIRNILQNSASGNNNEAIKLVYQFASKYRMLSYIDAMQQYIIEHKTELNPRNLMNFAIHLITHSTVVEGVKMGLALLELFDTNQREDWKQIIRTLALSDEFSLFAAFDIQGWDNADRELFEAAQKVRGWGRIHLIRILHPEEDMYEWLVLHGIENEIMPEYSALDIYQKIPFMGILSDNLSLELYRAMAAIMDALLNEGPVHGISSVEEPHSLFSVFISATKKRNDLKEEDYHTCKELLHYMEANIQKDYEDLIKLIKTLPTCSNEE